MLLDGLGGDFVRQGAHVKLVLAEEVGIVGGGEVGSEFADFGVDGLADGLGQCVDFRLFLGGKGCRSHGRTPVPK